MTEGRHALGSFIHCFYLILLSFIFDFRITFDFSPHPICLNLNFNSFPTIFFLSLSHTLLPNDLTYIYSMSSYLHHQTERVFLRYPIPFLLSIPESQWPTVSSALMGMKLHSAVFYLLQVDNHCSLVA